MMKAFVIFLLLIAGCNPAPDPQVDPDPSGDSTVVNDSTQIFSEWEVMKYNDDGYPIFFIKEDGDSTTMVSIDEGLVDYDVQYAILYDIRLSKRRMIAVSTIYMTIADTSRWFFLDIIPDKINYDIYSPNQ